MNLIFYEIKRVVVVISAVFSFDALTNLKLKGLTQIFLSYSFLGQKLNMSLSELKFLFFKDFIY